MMPFFEFEAITGNYFLMYFFTSFMYAGKRRWPSDTIGIGMASDIANYCSTCLVCQRQNKMPKKTSEGSMRCKYDHSNCKDFAKAENAA